MTPTTDTAEPRKAKAAPKTKTRPRWVLKAKGQETPIADWARTNGKMPGEVRSALRKHVGKPQIVTWEQLQKAISQGKE
jgi:hypothetical protein